MLRRLFDASYRKARALEARGDYRGAAALYAEGGANDEAADALLFSGAHASSARERAEAYAAALRFMAPQDKRRAKAESEIARAVIADAPGASALSSDERARVAEAAAKLEEHQLFQEAVRGYELASDSEGVARCLTKAGDVETLEAVLTRDVAEEGRERDVQRALRAYEELMPLGARLDARAALLRARDASADPRIEELLVRLDARFPPAHCVDMRVGEKRVVCVGKWPVVLGRDADVSIRGTSVSRQHCELSLVGDGRIRIKDLASRNGTLLARVPIQSSLDVDSGVQLGLGDDVHAQLSLIPSATSNAIQVEVLDGPDRALVALLGEERMQLTGTRASIEFVNGRASLHAQDGASLRLAGIVTTMPIVLLRGDSIEVDGVRVEVSA